MRCWRAASARKRSMHSGLARPRGALHGVIAHQARASNPDPLQAALAARGDLAAALAVCTFGRVVRWRSRAVVRGACGATLAAAVDRGGTTDTACRLSPDGATDAGASSRFTHMATECVPGDVMGGPTVDSAADGSLAGGLVGTLVVACGSAGAGSVVGGAAPEGGAGVTSDVATHVVVCLVPLATAVAGPEGPSDDPLNVHAPQPSATMPIKASDTAALM